MDEVSSGDRTSTDEPGRRDGPPHTPPGETAYGADGDASSSIYLVDRAPEPGSGSSWWIVGVAGVMVTVGAAYLFGAPKLTGDLSRYGAGSPGAGTPEVRDSTARGEAALSPGPTASGPGATSGARSASTGGGASSGRTAPPLRGTDGRVPAFARTADEVAEALGRYRERRELYEEGRLGCESLRTAQSVVDRRFMELAVLFREHRPDLDSAAAARFDDLASRTDRAERHFDGSRCTSPR